MAPEDHHPDANLADPVDDLMGTSVPEHLQVGIQIGHVDLVDAAVSEENFSRRLVVLVGTIRGQGGPGSEFRDPLGGESVPPIPSAQVRDVT